MRRLVASISRSAAALRTRIALRAATSCAFFTRCACVLLRSSSTPTRTLVSTDSSPSCSSCSSCASGPKLSPCTTMVALPAVGPASAPFTTGAPYANLTSLLRSLTRSSTDTCTHLSTPVPGGVRHLSAVCDTHVVRAHGTPPMKATARSSSSPKLSPCTVTSSPPSVAPVAGYTSDTTGPMYSHMLLSSLLRWCTVTTTLLHVPAPAGTTHSSRRSDSQRVLWHLRPPTYAVAPEVASPKPLPKMRTVYPPSVRPRYGVTRSTCSGSYSNRCVWLLVTPDTVTATTFVLPHPGGVRHTTSVSDTRVVFRHGTPPMEATVCSLPSRPNHSPLITSSWCPLS
mmetsp:Transcript_2551/g.7549  ORF Transcript_2551/g.7549 Transcript_2551/m.7549 type:complete len:341 (-) Transcript_2551:6473-7495(-)